MAETTSAPGTATKLIAEALGTFLLVFGSIGTALFAANFGASARDVVAPAEKMATSRPEGSAVAASSTRIWRPPKSILVPADRADAKNLSSACGKSRSNNSVRMTLPTMPVAPTTPTLGFLLKGTASG